MRFDSQRMSKRASRMQNISKNVKLKKRVMRLFSPQSLLTVADVVDEDVFAKAVREEKQTRPQLTFIRFGKCGVAFAPLLFELKSALRTPGSGFARG